MVINSRNTEFGYELIATLPYAYSMHMQGKLTGTVSASGSGPFYFFSPDHRIDASPRDFANTAAAAKEIPNMWIHKPRLDKTNWVPPPYKDFYGPIAIRFERPTVVVYNRYNMEWGKPPINYFDLPTLRSLFSMLCPQYTVVYFNVRGQEDLEDNAHSMDLGDYEMIASEFPEVRVIHDIVEDNGEDYNLTQLRIFAGCEKFITMNGGPSILASHFGGENIIYTKECRELRSSVNSFFNWYGDLGNSHIRVVNTHGDLLDAVRVAWVDRAPLLNILVRCHNRPKGFKRLIESARGYPNVRFICSYDNDETWRYLHKERVEKVRVDPAPPERQPPGEEYRNPLPANAYFNEMYKRVLGGYVMFMDDDDEFTEYSTGRIARQAEEDRMLLWRVNTRQGKSVPSNDHWGTITAGDISGIGVCFHSKWIEQAQWEPWRRGDYRVIKNLSKVIKPKWLNEHLTQMARLVDEITPKERIEAAKAKAKEAAEELAIEASRRKIEDEKVRAGESPLPFIQRRKQWLTTRRSRRT